MDGAENNIRAKKETASLFKKFFYVKLSEKL